MAAAVLFDLQRLASGAGRELLEELDDSKRLGSTTCQRLARAVVTHAEAVSVVSIPASRIDRIGIDPANAACLERALRAIGEQAELRLVDGDRLALGAEAPVHERIVRGDATSATIAAASVVAKAARDRLMARLSAGYPEYGFERNKGYGSEEHVVALATLGHTPEHRRTFIVRRLARVAAPPRRSRSRSASWRQLPAAELAAHLLEKRTIADGVWTDQQRLPGENRTAFIRRVLLGDS